MTPDMTTAECAACGHYEVFHAPSEDGACQTVDRATLLECKCERFRLADAPLHDDYLAGMPQPDSQVKKQRKLAQDLAKQAAEWATASEADCEPADIAQAFALASIALSLAWRDQP